MKILQTILSIIILSLGITTQGWAKKPEGKGNPHKQGPDARWINSNRQSDESSLRGKARAEERHYLKQKKKYKDKKHKQYKDKAYREYDDDERYQRKYRKNNESDERYERYERYERQRRLERYQNDPVKSIIDHNIEGAKSKIDRVHRRAMESIEEKQRQLYETTPPPRQQTTNPWWSIFGSEE